MLGKFAKDEIMVFKYKPARGHMSRTKDHLKKASVRNKSFALLTAFLLLVQWLAIQAEAQVVTNASDSGPGTLRYAISNVIDNAVITFATNLSGTTITLASTLSINTNLVIDASQLFAGLQINGNASATVFTVASNCAATLKALIITNGLIGIFNSGMLTLNSCTIVSNRAPAGYGGGIVNFGTLVANQCTLSKNLVNIPITIPAGAAIYNKGSATLNACTVAGNISTGWAGGIYNLGTLTLFNSIVASNTAHILGPDIFNGSSSSIYLGSNLVEAIYNTGAVTNTGPAPISAQPLLAPLGNYGGPTPTMPPLPGSPAIDAASDSVTNLFASDQRGSWRLLGLHADIGAVEGVYNVAGPGQLTGVTVPPGGGLQISFTNYTDTSYTVFGTTNPTLLFNLWSNLGVAAESPNGSGHFQFTDPHGATNLQYFYRIR